VLAALSSALDLSLSRYVGKTPEELEEDFTYQNLQGTAASRRPDARRPGWGLGDENLGTHIEAFIEINYSKASPSFSDLRR